MTKISYNLIVLVAFLVGGITEFFLREGAGFTLTAFVFYGLYHIIINIMYLIKLDQDEDRADSRNRRG